MFPLNHRIPSQTLIVFLLKPAIPLFCTAGPLVDYWGQKDLPAKAVSGCSLPRTLRAPRPTGSIPGEHLPSPLPFSLFESLLVQKEAKIFQRFAAFLLCRGCFHICLEFPKGLFQFLLVLAMLGEDLF